MKPVIFIATKTYSGFVNISSQYPEWRCSFVGRPEDLAGVRGGIIYISSTLRPTVTGQNIETVAKSRDMKIYASVSKIDKHLNSPKPVSASLVIGSGYIEEIKETQMMVRNTDKYSFKTSSSYGIRWEEFAEDLCAEKPVVFITIETEKDGEDCYIGIYPPILHGLGKHDKFTKIERPKTGFKEEDEATFYSPNGEFTRIRRKHLPKWLAYVKKCRDVPYLEQDKPIVTVEYLGV